MTLVKNINATCRTFFARLGVIAVVGKKFYSFKILTGESRAFTILQSGNKKYETYLKLSM